METIRLFAISGQDETGRWMYVVEVNRDIYVFDCGSKKPDIDKLGVDYVIPDFSYLLKNKSRVKAIFITQGLYSSYGGIALLLRENNVPIYTSKLVRSLILKDAKRFGITISSSVWNIIGLDSFMEIGGRKVCFFSTTTQLPFSFGVALLTQHGYIVYASSFIFDFSAKGDFKMNLPFLSQITSEKLYLSLINCDKADNVGYTSPMHRIAPYIEEDIAGDRRVIISLFSYDFFRLFEIIHLCQEHNKKVCLYSRSFKEELDELVREGTINLPDIFVDYNYLDNHDDVVVILSGDGKHLLREISRIVEGRSDKHMTLKKDDIFVFMPIEDITLDRIISDSLDDLYHSDITIKVVSKKDLKTIAPSQEDIKLFLSYFKSKYVAPICAEYRHLYEACHLIAKEIEGYSYSSLLLFLNGEIIDNTGDDLIITSDVIQTEEKYVDGYGVGDSTSAALKDRKELSQGVIIIGATIDKKIKKLISHIDVQMRGVSLPKESSEIASEISHICEQTISEHRFRGWNFDSCMEDIVSKVQKSLARALRGQKPTVLPAIVEF
jgi:ribonuclease J